MTFEFSYPGWRGLCNFRSIHIKAWYLPHKGAWSNHIPFIANLCVYLVLSGQFAALPFRNFVLSLVFCLPVGANSKMFMFLVINLVLTLGCNLSVIYPWSLFVPLSPPLTSNVLERFDLNVMLLLIILEEFMN